MEAISCLRRGAEDQRQSLGLVAVGNGKISPAEQDKRTRHAIADAVAQHLLELGIELPGIDGVIINCRGGLTND
jgi:hypothetical protein